MGWCELTSIDNSPSQKKEALRDRIFDGIRYICIRDTLRGNHYFGICSDRKTNHWFLVIGVLSKYDGATYYKVMEESEGPYIYDCPKLYLTLTKPCGRFSEEWREKVLAYWKNKKSAR